MRLISVMTHDNYHHFDCQKSNKHVVDTRILTALCTFKIVYCHNHDTYLLNDYQNFLIQDFFLAYNEFLMHISLAWRLFIVHYA